MAIANPHFPEIDTMRKKITGNRKFLKMYRKRRCAKTWRYSENVN